MSSINLDPDHPLDKEGNWGISLYVLRGMWNCVPKPWRDNIVTILHTVLGCLWWLLTLIGGWATSNFVLKVLSTLPLLVACGYEGTLWIIALTKTHKALSYVLIGIIGYALLDLFIWGLGNLWHRCSNWFFYIFVRWLRRRVVDRRVRAWTISNFVMNASILLINFTNVRVVYLLAAFSISLVATISVTFGRRDSMGILDGFTTCFYICTLTFFSAVPHRLPEAKICLAALCALLASTVGLELEEENGSNPLAWSELNKTVHQICGYLGKLSNYVSQMRQCDCQCHCHRGQKTTNPEIRADAFRHSRSFTSTDDVLHSRPFIPTHSRPFTSRSQNGINGAWVATWSRFRRGPSSGTPTTTATPTGQATSVPRAVSPASALPQPQSNPASAPVATPATSLPAAVPVPQQGKGTVASALLEILEGGTWDRDTVVRALHTAFNNPERAVDSVGDTACTDIPLSEVDDDMATSIEPPEIILDTAIFNTETPILFYLSEEDMSSVMLEGVYATMNNVLFYIRYLSEKIALAGKESTFCFVNPVVLAVGLASQKKELMAKRNELANCMANTNSKYIFVPYFNIIHWLLMVVDLSIPAIWWLDSLGGSPEADIIELMERVVSDCAKRKPYWSTPSCVPRQPGGWECGFYIMRFMKEIIEEPNPFTRLTGFTKEKYEKVDIIEVKREWINHLKPQLRAQIRTVAPSPEQFQPKISTTGMQSEDGTDDQKKGTQLLEVDAIEIQMYTETKNNKKLKQLYEKALSIKSAIPHPRIMGIIHECGGKMHMAERQWAEAATDFFEAFKNYEEAGNQRRIQCLKYLVLANMLMESEVNPFDAQEAKPYTNDPEILAMTNLIAAYQRNEILEFETILKSNRKTIMDDPFIRNYIEDLVKNIRTPVLLKLIKPYTRIRIPFISKELNVPEKDVEQLLVSLILDNRVQGHIDQVNRLLERSDRSKGTKTYAAIEQWNTQLKVLCQTINNRVGS